MIKNELRPYENYKSIDLPWLNSIPEHWSVSRNKNMMFQAKSLVGGNHHNYKLLSLTLNGVIARDMVNPKGKFPKEFDTYQIVRQKDLVFCLFDIDETPRTVGISPFEGMITGAYTVFNVKNANERYLYYYYLALDNNKMLKPLYTGLRKVVSADTFLRTKLPVPPRSEQDQIVKYLDHQLVKINKFINAKKKLIAVLKEQKQVVINEAVTKGLNPDVKMKPSSIEWIGEVPEHWEVIRIKQCISSITNGTWGDDIVDKNDKNNIVCVRVADFEMENLGISDLKLTFRSINRSKNKSRILKPGDLLIEKSGGGENQPVGRVVLFDKDYEAVCSNFVAKISVDKGRVNSLFLLYVLQNIQSQRQTIPFIKQTTGIQNLDTNSYFSLNIPLPQLGEQAKIVEYILEKCNSINRSIRMIEREIVLLTEYKNSLISDVVTGKVDVRNIVVEELEEEIIEGTELDEDSIDEEVLEEEDGDE